MMIEKVRDLIVRQSMKITSRVRWKEIRARGHLRWVLRQGVVGFGAPLTVAMLGYYFVVKPAVLSADPGAGWWEVVLVFGTAGALGGYVLADRAWHSAEERFG